MSLLSVVLVAAAPHNSDPLPWQTSLSTCWTNSSCNRALLVGHGGDPNFVTLPPRVRISRILHIWVERSLSASLWCSFAAPRQPLSSFLK